MKAPWTKWLDRRERAAVEAARNGIEREFAARALKNLGEQTNPFPSFTPIAGYPGVQKSPYPLYSLDRPIWYATPTSPRRRPDSVVDIDTIRKFADTYDVMRSCINHLKREVQAQPFRIVPRDTADDSEGTQGRITQAGKFFTKAGGLGERNETRRHYEQKILEDTLVVGAFASWKNRSRGGDLLQILAIDAATIRPRLDPYGWPGPGEDWYEQWILGMKVTGFGPDEIVYDGLWPVTHSPWFRSPVEYLIFTTLTALKSDEWNRSWLTDGNTPGQTIAVPPEWTPEQIMLYREYFNQMLAGDTRERQKSVFIPGGAKESRPLSRKDQDFQEFDLWLLRRTCAMYGVQPASIGFAGEQYKVAQGDSNDQTTQFGAGALLDLRKEHYDDVLTDLGYEDLEILNGANAEEDPLKRAQRLTLAMGGQPWINAADARKEEGWTGVYEPEPAAKIAPLDSDGEEDGVPEKDDMKRWMRKCLKRVKDGKAALCDFTSEFIPDERMNSLRHWLSGCSTPDDVKRAFGFYLASEQSR